MNNIKKKDHDYAFVSIFIIQNDALDAKFIGIENFILGHFNYHHDRVKMTFKCDICQKSFAQKPNLYRHRAAVHKLGGKSYKCSNCGYETARSDNFKKHTKNCTQKAQNTLKWQENLNVKLQRKRKRKIGPELPATRNKRNKTEYTCRMCGDMFENRRKLYVHQHKVSQSSFFCNQKIVIVNALIL